MLIFLILLFLLLVASGMALNFQNLDIITINFWNFSFNTKIGLIIIIPFMVGLLLPLIFMMPPFVTRGYRIRKLKEEIQKMQKKVDESAISFESGGLGNEGDAYKHY